MADRIQLINSRQMLKRVRGGRDGMYPFLENDTLDIVKSGTDFHGDALDAVLSAVVTGVDGVLAIVADSINGEATLTASADAGDNEYGATNVYGQLAYDGDHNPVLAVRLKIDDITVSKIEVGFTDDINDAGAALVLATPTATADDCAIWVRDTDDVGNSAWQAFSCIAAGTPQKEETNTVSPVNATYQTLIVGLQGTDAYFAILDENNGLVSGPYVIAAAITSTDKLTPWVFVQNRDGTATHTLTIDTIDIRQRRTTG